jgi:GntR family transcriptional regulator
VTTQHTPGQGRRSAEQGRLRQLASNTGQAAEPTEAVAHSDATTPASMSATADASVPPVGAEARAKPPAASRRPARYRTIAAAIAERIKVEDLPPGSLLPSETELAEEFGVTRMTVRQALAGLAGAGLIERRHGRGTIVAPIKLQRQSQLPMGLADELQARGLVPGSHVLEFDEVAPNPEDRALLWVGPRGTVYRLVRLRYASDVLIGLQETLIPTKYVPGIDKSAFENESIFRILRERHGLIPTRSDNDLAAVAADRRVAKALDIDVGTAVLRSTSVSYLEGGRPLERTIGWFIGSRYSYRVRQGHP